MRYYIDFEFEDEKLTPLSLGVVSQSGAELYLVNVSHKLVINASKNREWLAQNVEPFLYATDQHRTYHVDHWADAIRDFVSVDESPEFWGYYCDYDWVIFCQLFGRMLDLPSHFPKYCLDLKQLSKSVGITESLKTLVPEKLAHNALADARWIRDVHNQIIFQHGRSI